MLSLKFGMVMQNLDDFFQENVAKFSKKMKAIPPPPKKKKNHNKKQKQKQQKTKKQQNKKKTKKKNKKNMGSATDVVFFRWRHFASP